MARLPTLLAGRGLVGSSSSAGCKLFTGVAGSEARAEEIDAAALGASLFRRLRPPLRPRRRRCLSGVSADSSVDFGEGFSGSWKAEAVDAADDPAFSVRDGDGSGGATEGGVKGTLLEVSDESACATSAPSLPAASCAFVFQSALRKRSAAARYHLAASGFCPDVSK